MASPLLQTIQSIGNGQYVYNGPNGTVTFNLSNITNSSNPALQAQVAQTIDNMATAAATQGGPAAQILNNLAGRTINYYDNQSDFAAATGQPFPSQPANGWTSTNTTGPISTWLDPTAGAGTGQASFSSLIGITDHELMHAAGFSHPDAVSAPGSSVVGYGDSDWTTEMDSLKAELSGKPIYNPADGNTYSIDSQSWTFNDNGVEYPDGMTMTATNITPSADGLVPNQLIMDVLTQKNGETQLSEVDSFQVADSGQIVSDVGVFGSTGSTASETVQIETAAGVIQSTDQYTFSGLTAAPTLTSAGQLTVPTTAGTYHIDPATGEITDAGAVTATINGQTVTLLDLGGSSPFAVASSGGTITASAVSFKEALDEKSDR